MHNSKNETGKARQAALNLQTIERYLINDTRASYVVSDLDNILFYINSLYGESDEISSNKEHSDAVFKLTMLRNLFLITAIDNNEELEFDRIRNYFLSR